MKNETKLRASYEKQKQIYNEARNHRFENRNTEISLIKEKVQRLQARIVLLEAQNSADEEFESFESFRSKASAASQQSLQAKAST